MIRLADYSLLCKITPAKPCEVDVPAQPEDIVLIAESDKFKKKDSDDKSSTAIIHSNKVGI